MSLNKTNRTKKLYPSDPGGGNVHYPQISSYDPTSMFIHAHPSLIPTPSQSSSIISNNPQNNKNPSTHNFHHQNDSWSLGDSCDSIEEGLSISASSHYHHLTHHPNPYSYHHNQHSGMTSSKPNPAWTKVKKSSAKSPYLLTRPSWFDAETALNQIEKGKAQGNGTSLWLRFMIQARFFELGLWIQNKAGAIMFIASLILVVCLAGLKSVHIEDNVEKLWIEDGGRLEKELQYVRNNLGDGHGTTNQIVIQTPKYVNGSVLNSEALLFHLKVMRTAITTTVEMFDATWNLKDICLTPSSPFFDKHHLDSLLDNVFPCSIITPLDCFWEGSKLLGPEIPVKIPVLNQNVQWTNLNPQQIVDMMITMMKQSIISSVVDSSSNLIDFENFSSNPALGPLETIQKFMKRVGITTAYQAKPCLDPQDLNCPQTSPNKQSAQPPNIGYELTNGCYGFATKYMHWIEDLIVGGVSKNRSGHIVRAKALQSIVQLMGEQNLFDYHQRTIKVQHVLDWSIDKARTILQAWQLKFSEELERFMAETDFVGSQQYNVNHFTSASLTEIMRNFSEVNFIRLGIGYLLMLLYAGFSLSRWRNKAVQMERSQSILGMLGVLLIGLAVASGLGVCALIGLPFNASTTQIVPFLALGLGIDNMFLLAHVYTTDYMINYVPYEFRTAECLKQGGFNILLSSIGNIVAFCSAAIIPIPALRYFALQTAILIAFISIAVIVLFPALVSIDLRFRSLYLQETGHDGANSQCSFTTSFLINMCFYLFCCRTPHFHQREISNLTTTSKSTDHQQHVSVSSQLSSLSFDSASSLFKQPYLYKQPYNFAYLNSIQTTSDEDQNKKTSLRKTSEICRCEITSSSGDNISDDESMFKLMRQCQHCGGDLRTQCDGQDDDHLDFQETSPIAPSSLSKSIPSIQTTQTSISSTSNCIMESSRLKNTHNFKCSTTYFVQEYLAPALKRRPIKVLVLLIYVLFVIISVIGITKVNDGLDLTDIVPRGTNEYRFLELRRQYFSYYNIFAVTKGNFDYPNNQRMLYDYHQAFNRIDAIIKNDDGGLPEFWLPMFRDWLRELQDAFDRDRERGCITRERWFPNATTEAILAYKLLVQTGRSDNPVDKSLVLTTRLVNHQGIINPKAFYNYLTAWVSNDIMAYEASQALFKPEPRQWLHEAHDVELKIPKSPPLIFSQIPFHLNNIRTNEEIVKTIQDVRSVCERFEERGLPNFPIGIPFTYWEQYIGLRFYMIMALMAVFVGIFFSTMVLMCGIWTPMIIVFNLIINVVQLFGFMGWIGIKLSALPAVILIVSIGVSLNSLVHITISFNTAIGNRNQRMVMALQHMSNPVKHGIISTLFGLIMLAFSEFDFIIRYFFCVLGASVLIVTMNSLILLPVILSTIGPKAEVIPLEHKDRISTPSPPPSPIIAWSPSINSPSNNRYMESLMLETGGRDSDRKSNRTSPLFNRYRARRKELQRIHSQLSLSTISEEPSSYHSTPTPTNTPTPQNNNHQPTTNMTVGGAPSSSAINTSQPIVVQPEFVVETTITNNNNNNSNSKTTSTATTTTLPTSENGSETNSSPSPHSFDAPGDIDSSRCESSISSTSSTTTVTTKVMATAKLTVELHPYTSSPTPPATNTNFNSQNVQPQQHSVQKQQLQQIIPTLVSFPGANYHSHIQYQPTGHHYQMAPPQAFFMAPPSYHHPQQQPQMVSHSFNHNLVCRSNRNCFVNCPPPSSAINLNATSQSLRRLQPSSNGSIQGWR